MLPFSYAFRNLIREPGKLAQKLVGSSVLLFLVMAAATFNHGMEDLLQESGSPHNVILLGAGSEESIERSQIPLQTETIAAAGIRGVDTRGGIVAISGEVVYMGLIQAGTETPRQGLTRGVTPAALEVHREVRLVEGSWPSSGEVMVGTLAHHALGLHPEDLKVGNSIRFEEESFRISGRFSARGTIMESEIWFPRADLRSVIQRETLSCVIARMKNPSDMKWADLFAKQRLDLQVVALPETEYYAELSSFYGPVRTMTWLTAIMIAIGAVMGGLNLLYASFSSRIQEIATLQTVGYKRISIFFSLLQESLLSQLLGFLVAITLGILFLEGVMIPFSIGTFTLEISPQVFLTTFLVAFALGTIGTLPPALRCLNIPVPKALKSYS